MSKWEVFARKTFLAMNAVLPEWKDSCNEGKRSSTRFLYDQVFCVGEPNKTGYISIEAMTAKRKGNKTTKDHCLSPQFVARMIYDNPDVWLTNFDKFKSLFLMCCQTIEVTPQENKKLSKLTENRNGQFVIHVPTHKKYEHLNIILFHPEKGVVSDVFDDLVPRELLDYEKQYLINS
jgi:hypothetical protein